MVFSVQFSFNFLLNLKENFYFKKCARTPILITTDDDHNDHDDDNDNDNDDK